MKFLRTTTLITAILTLLCANVSRAAYLDMGTLDVQPLQGDSSNGQWFVEYANRGDSVIRYVQIANFGPEAKQVELYSTDSSKKLSENFVAQTREEAPQKIAPWMTMPATELTINSGETKIVPVTIRIPLNGGIGLHAGAVIVREKNIAQGTEFHVEKGVRVYLNVKGNVIDSSTVTTGQVTQTFNSAGVNFVLQNQGTTDFDSPVSLELQNIRGETVAVQKTGVYARPGEKTSVQLTVKKPAFGVYSLMLTSDQAVNGRTEFNAGTLVVVPYWALLLLAALAMGGSFVTSKARSSQKAPAFSFKKLFNSAEFQKASSFLGILIVSAIVTVPLATIKMPQPLFADVLQQGPPDSYEVTVKWGDLRKLVIHKNDKMDWHGQITFTGAKAVIKQTLDLEPMDAVNVVNDGTVVNFNLSTTSNNDGVVLTVTPTGASAPKLTFENYNTGIVKTFDLQKLIGSHIVIPNRQFAASIDIKAVTAAQLRALATLNELNATPENEATPEVNINIPELKSIFQDIPATPEVLSEFILTSDYVKKISTENALTKIETDPSLIRALEATPEIVQEIAATPNLNFTFVPSDTIQFPPQQFSFKQDKTSAQDLGTLIFVQNKNTPWNTYIGTTNFVSLSGRGVIPAGNLTVIPGETRILRQTDGAQVVPGARKTIQGTFDKSILVNVQPGTSNIQSKTIFAMNPKLEIKIPRGTVPGRYRGLLTITSL